MIIRYPIVYGGTRLPKPARKPITFTIRVGEKLQKVTINVRALTTDWTQVDARVEGLVTYNGEEVFAHAVYEYDSDNPHLGEIHIYAP